MADSTPNPNLSPCVTHQPSLLGGAENMKLLFDEELDHRRESLARQRAWEAITLEQAQIANRRAQNAATIDHAINAGLVLAGQAGATEGQQTVSPAGIAASETTKGAVAGRSRRSGERGSRHRQRGEFVHVADAGDR